MTVTLPLPLPLPLPDNSIPHIQAIQAIQAILIPFRLFTQTRLEYPLLVHHSLLSYLNCNIFSFHSLASSFSSRIPRRTATVVTFSCTS